MRWLLKPIKADHSGERSFEKTFPVHCNREEISAGFVTLYMFHAWGYRDDWFCSYAAIFTHGHLQKGDYSHLKTSSFGKGQAGRAITTCHVKGNSPHICGTTAYASAPDSGSIRAAFPWLELSVSRIAHMNVYRRPLELAGLVIARKTGLILVVVLGTVEAYAQYISQRYVERHHLTMIFKVRAL